ncbi:DUF6640 family protein [Spirosoma arcticum]
MKTGKLIISFVAVFTAVSPYLADWNQTHIYNPDWPPHAKFHNAQTMIFGAYLGLLSLWALWGRKDLADKESLNQGTLFAALYWLAQLPAILFPGTAFKDANGLTMPTVLGIQTNQVLFSVVFILPLIGLGYYLERNRIYQSSIRQPFIK